MSHITLQSFLYRIERAETHRELRRLAAEAHRVGYNSRQADILNEATRKRWSEVGIPG